MTNTLSALSVRPPDGWTPTHTHTHTRRVSIEDVSGRSQGEIPYFVYVCVRACRVTCLGLMSQDGKYGKAAFPSPQQRKSLDRIFCSVLPGRSLIHFEWEVRQTRHAAQGHVISRPSVFLWPLWASDTVLCFKNNCLQLRWVMSFSFVSKGSVVVCPQDDVIAVSRTQMLFCSRKICFMASGMWQQREEVMHICVRGFTGPKSFCYELRKKSWADLVPAVTLLPPINHMKLSVVAALSMILSIAVGSETHTKSRVRAAAMKSLNYTGAVFPGAARAVA